MAVVIPSNIASIWRISILPAFPSEDAKEGIAAFREKGAEPAWKREIETETFPPKYREMSS